MAVGTQVVYPALGRNLSPEFIALGAQVFAESGVVDACLFPDFVFDVAPPSLEQPGADVMGMKGSFGDPFIIAALAATAAENLGVAISTDSIRRNPTELIQTMLHLANLSNGKAFVHVGGGETMRIKPFGHKRSEGLTRMEDLFRLARLYWENDEPFDFQGNHFTMEKVSLGAEKSARPRYWALGGGPKLMDLAVKHADGMATAVPGVFPYPEKFAVQVTTMKEALEREGRDPEDFDFAVWLVTFTHEDRSFIDKAFQQPLIRWIASVAGRMNQPEWRAEGFEPPFGPPRFKDNFMYGMHYFPRSLTEDDVQHVLSRMSDEMVRMSYVNGTPNEVADIGKSFVDAGATHVVMYDCTPVANPTIEEGQASVQRMIDVCGQLKAYEG